MLRDRRSTRRSLAWGIVLVAAGAMAFAHNLGIRIPRDMWNYWPALIMGLGGILLAWPGPVRDRLSGVWLIGVGIYCWISVFELFDLNWYSAAPILIVALGIRIVLGGIFREEPKQPGNEGKQNGPGGIT